MKRVVVLATLLAALVPACKNAPETAAGPGSSAAAAPAPGNRAIAPLAHPLFWSVEKDGHTTYFLGTMHLGVDAETRLPTIVWDKLHTAAAFAMEADLDESQTAALIKPATGSLRQALGEDYWNKLEVAMGPAMAQAVDHLPPMVPAAALSMRGLPPTPAMDKVLSARATDEHKPIVFLEPVARQLAILARWMDVKALKMILDELGESEQRAKAMLDAYLEGDEQKLVAISDSEKDDALHHGYTAAEYDQEMNEMLYQRNASWIDALEKLHAAGGGFVAVGALHLLGPRSVLALLAQDGYRVTRVAP